MKCRLVSSVLFSFVLAATAAAQEATEEAAANIRVALQETDAGHYAEAVKYFQKGYPYTLKGRGFVYAYGLCLARLGQSNDAEAMFTRALNDSPERSWDAGNSKSRATIIAAASFELGRLQEKRGDWQAALGSYLRSDPRNLAARLAAGTILELKVHDYRRAIPHFEALLGDPEAAKLAKPNLANCYYELGLELEKAGDPRQAIECYNKSSAYDPTANEPKARRFVLMGGTVTPPARPAVVAPPKPPALSLPKEQVAEFFSALDNQDLDKVNAMLKAEPKLAVVSSDDPMDELPLLRARTPEIATALLKAGADPKKHSKSGASAMGLAATRDNPAVAAVLLAAKVKINDADTTTGKSPLHLAVDNFVGPTDTIEWLLRHRAVVDMRDGNRQTPLMLAVQNESSRRVAELLIVAGADLTLTDRSGATAADIAEKSGQAEFAGQLRALTKLGPKFPEILRGAISAKDIAEFRALLAAFPSLPQIRLPDTMTALQTVALNGFVEGTKLLLDAKAEVNAQEKGGRTALHFASLSQHSEVVKMLLDAGADAKLADSTGTLPLMLAAASPEGTACVNLLLAAGSDPNAKDNNNGTALSYAVGSDGLENVKLLLEHGGNPNTAQPDGTTLLHQAGFAVSGELLKHGANVNANGAMGTALHQKVADKNLKLVRLLVEHKADVNLRNPEGKTPLDLANEAAKAATDSGTPAPEIKEMIQYLSDHGAKLSKS